MVASRQVEVQFYRGIGRQRGRGFGSLEQIIGRTAIPFLRKHVVPDAKRGGADLLKFAPEIAKVKSGRKNIKTLPKSWVRQTLRKQLGSGNQQRKVIPTKSTKQASRSRRNFLTNISR